MLRPDSERRPCTISAVGDARGLEGPVRLLFRSDKNLGTGLQLILVAGDVGNDHRLGAHHQLLLAVLVLDRPHRSINSGNGLLDISVGHLALRLEFPVVMSLASAAPRFPAYTHLHCTYAP